MCPHCSILASLCVCCNRFRGIIAVPTHKSPASLPPLPHCLTRWVKVEEPVQPRPAGKGWCSQQCQQYKPPAAQEETAIFVQYDVKPEVPNLC